MLTGFVSGKPSAHRLFHPTNICHSKRRSYFSEGSWENKTDFWFQSARW